MILCIKKKKKKKKKYIYIYIYISLILIIYMGIFYISMNNESLKDELFCQLFKQITNNKSTKK